MFNHHDYHDHDDIIHVDDNDDDVIEVDDDDDHVIWACRC